MSKWTIYDKSGQPRCECIIEFDGEGRPVTQDTLEYSGSWMGECFLTVSVKSPYPIDFQIGDYIVYRGERFTINYDPTAVKRARRGTYGEGFVYDNIKFNSLSNELTEIRFHDWVLSDNKLHYTSLPNFPFYCKDVDDLADRLQANTDRWCKANGFPKEDYWMFYTLRNNTASGTKDNGQAQTTYERTVQRAQDVLESCGVSPSDAEYAEFTSKIRSQWESTYGTGEGYRDSRDDERYDRTITASSQTVWEMLASVKQQFGLNFIIRGRNVYIGTAGVPTSEIFQYGKGNGLYEVDKTADQDQLVVTKLHAYGSNENLPTRYYATLNAMPFVTITKILGDVPSEGNMYYLTDLPYSSRHFNNQTGTHNTNVPVYTVEMRAGGTGDDAPSTTAIVYEWIGGEEGTRIGVPIINSDAYRAFKAAAQVGTRLYLTDGVKKDSFTSSSITYLTRNLPDNMAVNFLMLPGFPNNSLADLCKAEYDGARNATTFYIRKDTNSEYVAFHTEEGSHVVSFSDNQYDPFILSPNAEALGVREGDIFCNEENDDNGLKKVYPTIEEVTDIEAGTGKTGTRLDVVVKADVIEDNGVYPNDKTDEIQGFSIYIPALGFNLRAAAEDAGGSEMKISMKNGFCGGRTFDVASCEEVTTGEMKGKWRLSCKRSQDTDLDLWFPYSYAASVAGVSPEMTGAYQIQTGDNYVLTGIAVSDVNYVWSASVRLLRKAIHWLCKNDYTRYVYSPKIDEIYMARQDMRAKADKTGATVSIHDTLKEGDMLNFADRDLGIEGSVYIDKLIIKENGNNGIPTYEVTLRNEVTVGTLQRIQNTVDSIKTDIERGNIGGGGVTPTGVDPLVRAYGSKYFLSKLTDDVSQGVITFVKGLLLGNGGYGMTGEGEARLRDITIGPDGKFSITPSGLATLAGMVAKYMTTPDFKSGYLGGSGFGAYKDANGKSVVETDNLIVRMKAYFAELEIRKLSYVGGDQVKSFAGSKIAKVVALDDSGAVLGDDAATPAAYKCYYIDDDGTTRTENWWRVGDQACCRTFDIDAGAYKDVSNTYYWRLVTSTGAEDVTVGTDENGDAVTKHMGYVVLSNIPTGFTITDPSTGEAYKDAAGNAVTFIGKDPAADNDAPMAEDKIVQLGSQLDASRSYAVIDYITEQRTSYYYGISGYSLDGKEVMRLSPFGSWVYTQNFEMRVGGPGNWHPMVNYRGDWDKDTAYAYYDEVSHDGLLWLHSKSGHASTGDEPNPFSEVWTIVSDGGNALRIEFESDKGNVVYVDNVDIRLTAHLMFGQKSYDDILLQSVNNLIWTRDSGVESEDKSWKATTGETPNVLLISHHNPQTAAGQRRDLGSRWEDELHCAFTLTATIYPGGDISKSASSFKATATIGNMDK